MLGDSFLGFFPFTFGPRRQLLKTEFSTAAILFSRCPPCNIQIYRCFKSQLLLPIHFKFSTVIHVTSGKNPIHFQWDHKNNMAAMDRYEKCEIGIAKLNSGRLTLNIFLVLPLYSVHGFYPIWGIALKLLKYSAFIVTKIVFFGWFTTGKF